MTQHEDHIRAQDASPTNTIIAEAPPKTVMTNTQPDEAAPCRLLEIPPELRIMIYKFVVVTTETDLVKDQDSKIIHTAPLARVNSQILIEVLPILEARSHAIFIGWTNFYTTDIIRLFTYLPLRACMIRDVCTALKCAEILNHPSYEGMERFLLSQAVRRSRSGRSQVMSGNTKTHPSNHRHPLMLPRDPAQEKDITPHDKDGQRAVIEALMLNGSKGSH